MENNTLEAMQKLLEISSSALLLFEGETLLAASAAAQRLFPTAKAGAGAEEIFGDAVGEYRGYTGTGSMLFPMEIDQIEYNLTVAECGGYCMVTVADAGQTVGRTTLRAVAQMMRQSMGTMMAVTPKILPMLEETGNAKAMLWAAELNRSLYTMLRVTGNLEAYCTYTGTMNLRTSREDLDQWLENLAEQVAPLCKEAGMTLRYHRPSGHFGCDIDSDRMERVMLNLLSNAIKFSKPGGEITITLRRSGGKCWISVRDQGCGITPEEMGAIFARGENRGQIPDPRWGVGLGLPIARGIVLAHGGRLLLESEPGKGTAVHIALNVSTTKQPLVLRSPVLYPQYSGGINSTLVELADVLPSSVFDTRGIDL